MAGPGEPVYVTVSALDAGHLTLPERLFVTDADPDKRSTVPSLSFLIQHPSSPASRPQRSVTNLVFDLGVKRDITGYTPAQQEHIAQRQPVTTDPDCAASLRYGAGGSTDSGKVLLDPQRDIDVVILSHVHWDHVGTPSDFGSAAFAVGSGTLDLLARGAGPLYPAELFNADEIPASRTVEFPAVPRRAAGYTEPQHTPAAPDALARLPASARHWSWKPLADAFPSTLDFFGDGSLLIIDTPGHLYGHVNLLARVAEHRYVYLGGDCCHDPRILRGERGIAEYDDGRGGTRSVHVHTAEARRALDDIAKFVKARGGRDQVEVVVAHDGEWRERNRTRFWPGRL
ncbi:uncharacterized protein E0L32_010315 [Thyridium curvatum]|uniref:Metallo-beta-lactamase domain-containing protein n=1 Tax=Thyridium curvatum TaxID=1093900 RepID=A0A507ANN7_9PEZI|nr:uncharacterized protein E0L32_010315 [Thyridium curvatum]TPX07984.1 hypothetical protein E0L32_010315 [Thyridium curvatum]